MKNSKVNIAKDFGKFSTSLCKEIVSIMRSTLDNLFKDPNIDWDDVKVSVFPDDFIDDAAKLAAQKTVTLFFDSLSDLGKNQCRCDSDDIKGNFNIQ